MIFSQTYRNQAQDKSLPKNQSSGKVGWRSPSNIALVKYWGKRSPQLPMNPSISFTLQNAFTETSIDFYYSTSNEGLILDFTFDGKPNDSFADRIFKYLNHLTDYIPIIKHLKLVVSSSNSFPHSAGIASSASAFSALALCMLDIELSVYDETPVEEDFFQKASFLARLGSGSASRSIYGGFVLWGKMPEIENSSDECAVKLSDRIHPVFRTFRDTILILDDQKKSVSSSVGHQLMEDHPFSAARFSQAKKNVYSLYNILIHGDLKKFIEIVESEALSLHALMLSSEPGYVLILPNTLEAIKRIREYRNRTKIPLCFTLDAGPNIHLLYPDIYEDKVKDFIVKEMIELCHRDQFISDCVGTGPLRI